MSASMLLSPFIPSDHALEQSALPNKAMALTSLSAKLAGRLAEQTQETLRRHMAVINSYYSNLIEGNKTRPHEIRAAQRGDYLADPVKRDLQLESLAHIRVQDWIALQTADLNKLYSPEFICSLHREFYSHIPESLWQIKDRAGAVLDKLIPGEWRTQNVVIGHHHPPEHDAVAELMLRFCEIYHPQRFTGDRKLIAIMAAHHRFAFIHPFVDGNGRIARLFTDTALKWSGLESCGAWCLSRGLARSADHYKGLLMQADAIRQGDYDGRGHLSEKGLLLFCEFMLDTALDQVAYMSNLLDLSQLRSRINAYVQARNDFRVPGCGKPLKSVSALILFNAFISGELERGVALELTGMPERSARRLLSQLKAEGLLSETNNKSPLSWEIPAHAEPWYFPDLVLGTV